MDGWSHMNDRTEDGRAMIIAVGECMLELRPDTDRWQLGHSGDTFNTAVYLARLGERVAYWTALGDDPFSLQMRNSWHAAGLDTSLVLTVPGKLPGLYAICNDAAGERSFYYWREQAAVRELFTAAGSPGALGRASAAELLYMSGITLALFGTAGRGVLMECARAVRAAGGEVAFDPNYRASLWQSPAAARQAMLAFAPVVSIALPTFGDEALLHEDCQPRDTTARWLAYGAKEVIVKLGMHGCMLADGEAVRPAEPLLAVDTTAAGDAFNAAYLAARRQHIEVRRAACFANRLAGRVITHRGAIIPSSAMSDLVSELGSMVRSADR